MNTYQLLVELISIVLEFKYLHHYSGIFNDIE